VAVRNVHARRLAVGTDRAGALIDTLAGADDRLWPHEWWPSMRFDRPLGVGAAGGHGPVRYRVVAYVPGQWVRFRFTGPRGFDGFHEYSVLGDGEDGAEICHLLVMRARGAARVTWPLLYRWLHDAVLEDSMDRAERELTGRVRRPARWNGYVRLLRRVLTR